MRWPRGRCISRWLRNRLPKVCALFAEGAISARLASALVWHSDLIKDPGTLQIIDETLADAANRLGALSVGKAAQAIDAIVHRHDPAAVRRTRIGGRSRDVVIEAEKHQSGTARLWGGSLFATDAAILDRKLTQMAHDVCDDDPRTLAQRRADALGALGAGAERLACGCGNAECQAGPRVDERASSVVIHVVAHEDTLDAQPDPHTSGEPASRPITPDMTLAEALAPDPEPDLPAEPKPAAHLIGGATIPAPMIAELVRNGAAVRWLRHPGDAPAEAAYRPSAQLERFIRCRDMTCRFPGCDRPAEFADIDHTIPYPMGPTHASNLKCLCRKHHLLKTFWTGWRDTQHPDGTVVWTSPSGRTYVTRPGSSLLFPTLCLPTGGIPSVPRADGTPRGNRGVMMPERRRTREQDRARRIDAERALNADLIAERNKGPTLPGPRRCAPLHGPPPF